MHVMFRNNFLFDIYLDKCVMRSFYDLPTPTLPFQSRITHKYILFLCMLFVGLT